jgi:succinate dehydrogenase / fumarate reductase, iron-sulfur subunit
MSFLEMLDEVNEDLIKAGQGPDRLRSRLPRRDLRHVFADDQRRRARPRRLLITVCQLHMRKFKDGDTIYIEPWRAAPSRSSRT